METEGTSTTAISPDAEHPSNNKPWLFKPGQSGNPNGRAMLPPELRAMCREAAPKAIAVAIKLYDDATQPGNVRLKACEIILDRAYGKAPQAVHADLRATGKVTIEYVHNWRSSDALPVIEVEAIAPPEPFEIAVVEDVDD